MPDQGTYSAEAGRTWPDWTPIIVGKGEMVTVRSDAEAFQNTQERIGTTFLRPDGSIWQLNYFVDGDPLQGGFLYQLQLVRQ